MRISEGDITQTGSSNYLEQPFDMRKMQGHNAVYERSSNGGGKWTVLKEYPQKFLFLGAPQIQLKLMGFKHTGVFPEQG